MVGSRKLVPRSAGWTGEEEEEGGQALSGKYIAIYFDVSKQNTVEKVVKESA